MVVYSDAGVSGNGTGYLQRGIVVVTDIDGKILIEKKIDCKTNNQLELFGIYLASQTGADTICSDSKIAIGWLTKNKRPKLKPTKDPEWDKDRNRWYSEWLPKIRKEVWSKKPRLVFVKREYNLAGHYIENKYGL